MTIVTFAIAFMLLNAESVRAGDAVQDILNLLELVFNGKTHSSGAKVAAMEGLYPQVQTSSGVLYGSNNSHAYSFYGIPYAVPPTGTLRFQPPQMINTPEIVRDSSTESRSACPQPRNTKVSEDCLVLNVDVPRHVDLSDPQQPPSKQLPVLFFIHGGSFFLGSGTNPMYEAKYLSEASDTVVVTINYRLGPLGFLSFDDGENVIDGNQGFKDQQLALQWVQNNIENFGGNKSRVTIFGESAGAQSVMFHLLSNVSEPMFQQAIMLSNPAIYEYPTRQKVSEIADNLADFLRCSLFDFFNYDCCSFRKDSYTCLMEASSEKLIEGMLKIMGSLYADWKVQDTLEPFRPTIGGSEFEKQPLELFKDGRWSKQKPLVLGFTEEELDITRHAMSSNWVMYLATNRLLFGDYKLLGNRADEISDTYENTFSNLTDYSLLFGKEMTDFWFACPNRALARFAAKTSESSVYFYSFDHVIDGRDCNQHFSILCGHSFHGADLLYVFRTLQRIGMNSGDDDILISDRVSSYMKNFAWTGKPSGDNSNIEDQVSRWPSYSSENDFSSLRIKYPEPYIEQNNRDQICNIWDSFDYYIAQ